VGEKGGEKEEGDGRGGNRYGEVEMVG